MEKHIKKYEEMRRHMQHYDFVPRQKRRSLNKRLSPLKRKSYKDLMQSQEVAMDMEAMEELDNENPEV